MNLNHSFIDCSWGKIHTVSSSLDNNEVFILLHGWMDNWSSFLPLIEKLDLNFIAVDFPGHGLSDHLPNGNWYHFVDYVVRLEEIVRKLNLDKFHIIGHSMGAAVGTVYAGTFPEEVKSLTLIDGFEPLVNPPEEAPGILRESILSRLGKTKPNRTYKDKRMAVKARLSSGKMEYDSAETLVNNQMELNEKGEWQWTFDPKLKLTSSLRMTPEQIQSFLKTIICPVLLISASNGFVSKSPHWNDRKLIKNLTEVELSGNHHIHMDSPKEVAESILQFQNL